MVKNQIPWFEAYGQLAQALYEFYLENKEKTGTALYTACKAEPGFMDKNHWLANYETVYGVSSMDPIQIFASFTGNKMKPENRQRRLNEFLVLLGQAPIESSISYQGCPAPNPVMLLNSRRLSDHPQIWRLFAAAYTRGRQTKSELTPALFNGYGEWYGIQITSLTIFLFWVNSANFLSLDGNSLKLLVLAERLKERPADFEGYQELLKQKNSEVYRNLALMAVDQLDHRLLPSRQRADLIAYLGPIGEEFLRPRVEEDIAARDPKDIQSEVEGKSKELPEALRQVRFQLLALRPLAMKDKLLKTLSAGAFYHFYQQYTFSEEKGKLQVVYHPEADLALYDAGSEEDIDQPQISISAIAGKNGAGKSNLVELLIMAVNNIAVQYFRKQYPNQTHNVDPIAGLKLELYFKWAPRTIYQVLIKDREVNIFPLRLSKDLKGEVKNDGKVDIPLEVLFYSILTNYSLHGLRSNAQEKPWLSKLFHKNDAYQVPIVLTPMRDNGTINVGRLFGQVKSRLVVNLLENLGLSQAQTEAEKEKVLSESFRQLTDTQRAERLRFRLKEWDQVIPNRYVDEDQNLDFLFNKVKPQPGQIFEAFQQAFPDTSLPPNRNLRRIIPAYIQKKLVTMCLRYVRYESFFDRKTLQFRNLPSLFEIIEGDTSHVAYKFKRVINFLRFNLYPHEDEFSFAIEDLSNQINKIPSGILNPSIDPLLPPSFYTPIVELRTQGAPNTAPLISFQRLSSGEKQRIYAASSLIYQLRNLNSVKGSRKIHKYSRVNVIFDEVELYFHPEWQRTYIDYLLRMIRRVNLPEITSINICFVTHSPFILSDIPASNILFLDKSGTDKSKTKAIPAPVSTFAANIHELLIDGFFMDHTVGEFARKRIESILKFCNEFRLSPKERPDQQQMREVRQGLKEHKKLVRMIGEDYIRGILENHLEEVEKNWFPASFRQTKIDRLQEELKREKALQAAEQNQNDIPPTLS